MRGRFIVHCGWVVIFSMLLSLVACRDEMNDESNDLDLRALNLLSELQANLDNVNLAEKDISRGFLLASLPAAESEQFASVIHELKVSLLVLQQRIESMDAFNRFDRYVKILEETPVIDKDRGRIEQLLEGLSALRNNLGDFHGVKITKQLYYHDFKDGTGGFKTKTVLGSTTWSFEKESAYMKISAHNRGASESWLLSPRFDLTQVVDAYMQVRQTHAFFTTWEDLQVLVSTDYSGGVPSSATWEKTEIALRPGEDEKWQFVTSEQIDLSQFQGKKLTVAFRYTASESAAPTWEIDSLLVGGSGDFKAEPIIDADSIAQPAGRGRNSDSKVSAEAENKDQGAATEEPSTPALWEASLGEQIAPFKEVNIAGESSQLWSVESQFKAAKANGYKKGPNKNWLVSPRLKIDADAKVSMRFDQAVAFFTTWDHMKVMLAVIDESFDGSDKSLSELDWQKLDVAQLPDTSKNWSFQTTEDLDLNPYAGKTVLLSFQYTCEESAAPGWEVRNIRLMGSGAVEALDL